MTNEQKSKVGRREFLRTFGASATAVAAAGTAPLTVPAHADTETRDEKRKSRYKPDSPHIQAYYQVNRYPTK